MKRANIRELHLRTGAIVDLAAEGHVVVILRRGTAVAELRPLSSKKRTTKLPERERLLATFPELSGDSGRFLEEDRG
jgi:antitoxin (DNA-binding transcriptional repressor) of toxin-antitoxin stability system